MRGRTIWMLAAIACCAAGASGQIVLEHFDGTSLITWAPGGDGVLTTSTTAGIGSNNVLLLAADVGEFPFESGTFITLEDNLSLQFEARGAPAALSHVTVVGDTVNEQLAIGAAGTYQIDLAGAGLYSLTLSANTFGLATAPAEAYFDNFTLTPEPMTLALLGVGASPLLLRRRR